MNRRRAHAPMPPPDPYHSEAIERGRLDGTIQNGMIHPTPSPPRSPAETSSPQGMHGLTRRPRRGVSHYYRRRTGG